MKKLMLLFASVAMLLGACSPYNYYSYKSEKADFTKYRTFAWLPSKDAKLTGVFDNSIAEERIVEAASQALNDKGLELDNQKPDLLIKYTAVVNDKTRTTKSGAILTDLVRVDELLMELPAIIHKNNSSHLADIFFNDLPENEMRCMVNGNYELLLSAFKNIAENGCKYAEDNKVKISLSFTPGNISILFSNLSDALEPEELTSLFQPFQRGSNAAGIKGYGLGLSLTRRIILMHKGDIKIEKTNAETIVSVDLPAAS